MPEEDINPRTAAAKKFDLSKKVGPFPLYVWVAGGVALLAGAYFLYKKHTASSTAATTPAATTTATGTTTGTGATGTGYQQYWPTTPTTPTTTAPSGTTGETLSGAGYEPPGGSTSGPPAGQPLTVSDFAGNVYTWLNGTQAIAYQQSGGQLFYQPTPGQFTQTTWGATPGGTAIFALSQPAGGAGGGRNESRALSVLGHVIRPNTRGTV